MTGRAIRRGLAVAALPLLGGLAYANAFAGRFYLDDYPTIVDNARLQSVETFRASIGEGIRLLTRTTFFVDRQLYGTDPAGYHLLNVLLHLTSGILVCLIVAHPAMRTWTDPRGARRHRLIAWWTAALFLLHPIATEAVTYISGRPTSLMSSAYLVAFLLLLEVRTANPGTRRRRLAMAGMLCGIALALLSKETAIVFPGLVLLYEGVIGRREVPGAGRAPIRVYLSLVAIAAILGALALTEERYAFLLHRSLALRDVSDNLLTQAGVVVFAMSLFVRPWRMNFDHDLPVATSLLDGPTLSAVGTILAVVVAAVTLARRAPLVSFGLLWFFLNLLPTHSILARDDLLSERNLYLPSIGLYLAVVAGMAGAVRWARTRGAAEPAVTTRPQRSARIAAWVAGAGLLTALAGATRSRNAIYADPVAFWSDAATKSPRKARPHTNLGVAWFRAGEPDRAIDEFRTALSLDPLDAVAQRNLLELWRITNPGSPSRR